MRLPATGPAGFIGAQTAIAAPLRAHRIDVIVNFAAESHNSLAELDPGRFFQTNVMGTLKLLEAAREVGIARVHHVSTCEVYGDLALDDPASFTEDSPCRCRLSDTVSWYSSNRSWWQPRLGGPQPVEASQWLNAWGEEENDFPIWTVSRVGSGARRFRCAGFGRAEHARRPDLPGGAAVSGRNRRG